MRLPLQLWINCKRGSLIRSRDSSESNMSISHLLFTVAGKRKNTRMVGDTEKRRSEKKNVNRMTGIETCLWQHSRSPPKVSSKDFIQILSRE